MKVIDLGKVSLKHYFTIIQICRNKNLNFRRVVKNFLGQGRFLKIRAQILNSSKSLNHMQKLTRACLKNNCLYQTPNILANIQARAYNFMIKRVPRGFNILTRQKKMSCFSSFTIYWDLTF